MYCLGCKTCDLTRRERRTPCGPVNDRTCVQCSPGQIVTSSQFDSYDSCTTCNDGSYPNSYADSANNRCAPCVDCGQDSEQDVPCTATTAKTCKLCTGNKRSSGLNMNCDGCIANYVRAGASCGICESASGPSTQAGCGDNQYIRCITTNTMGSRQCLFCQGHDHASSSKCAKGYGVSVFCKGASTVAVSCAVCPAGTERPAATPMVANADNTVRIQRCVPCTIGKYKVGANDGDCQACANKPDFSEYLAWSTTAADTSACPW